MPDITLPNLIYRPLVDTDIGALYDVRFSVTENRLHPHQVHLVMRSLILEQINQGGGWFCEDTASRTAVGFCLPILGDNPMIGGLFVRPSHHRRGIGKTLLNLAVDWLRDQQASEVTLVTDPGSNADYFYQSLGWIRGNLDEFGVQVVFTMPLLQKV